MIIYYASVEYLKPVTTLIISCHNEFFKRNQRIKNFIYGVLTVFKI